MHGLSVIANSSPLIHLARLERLDILFSLYQEIVIPEAVFEEIVVNGHQRPGSLAIRQHCEEKLIHVKKITDEKLFRAFKRELDYGEAAVLTLAMETRHDLILLDEYEARKTASLYHLKYTGFIGVILKAYKAGLIKNFKATLDQAIKNGFYINHELYKQLMNFDK